jgi:hypothetical protein
MFTRLRHVPIHRAGLLSTGDAVFASMRRRDLG